MILFKWFRSLIERILAFVKKLLPYILVGLAIYFSMGAFLPASWPIIGGLGGTSGALGALGLSFLFAPEETAAVISSAAEGIGSAATSVISSAGDILSAASSTLFSGVVPFLVVGVIGAGLYFVAKRKEEKAKEPGLAEPSDGPSRRISNGVA